MSALDRVERDSREKVMIPINVEGVTEDGGLTPKQGVTLFLLGMLLLIEVLFFKEKPIASSFTFWLIDIIIYLSIAQFVVRKLVFDEDYKMKQKKLKDEYTRCAPSVMWNVLAINEDNGVMQYIDGKIGIAIGIEQATIVGREVGFRDNHYEAISNFLREINKNGMKWVHIDIMMNARNDKRLTVLADTVNSCDIPAIQDMTRLHLGYLRSIEVRTLYEMEFYLIIATAAQGAEKLIKVVNSAVENLDMAAYNNVKVLGREAIAQLMAEQSNMDSFDADETMRQMAKKQSVIRNIFKLTQVTFRNSISEELIDEKAVNSENVNRGDTSTTVNLDDMKRNMLIGGIKNLVNKNVKIKTGTVEESLIGNKEKIRLQKLQNKDSNSTSDSNSDDVFEDGINSAIEGRIQEEKIFKLEGDVDIEDMSAFALSEEQAAQEVVEKLDGEEEWQKAKREEERKRSSLEKKEREQKELEEKLEEERQKQEKKKQIELREAEKRKLEERKHISVDDII